MTITIDSKTLNAMSLDENIEVVAVTNDAWENQEYKQKVRVFGIVKSWSLACYEKDVAWDDSVAKHLQNVAKNGNAVSFIVDEGTTHQVNMDVYVLGVTLNYSGGVANYRTFTVTLQGKT